VGDDLDPWVAAVFLLEAGIVLFCLLPLFVLLAGWLHVLVGKDL